jgi:hypothetical protein
MCEASNFQHPLFGQNPAFMQWQANHPNNMLNQLVNWHGGAGPNLNAWTMGNAPPATGHVPHGPLTPPPAQPGVTPRGPAFGD